MLSGPRNGGFEIMIESFATISIFTAAPLPRLYFYLGGSSLITFPATWTLHYHQSMQESPCRPASHSLLPALLAEILCILPVLF